MKSTETLRPTRSYDEIRKFDTLHTMTQFGADAAQGSVLGSWRQDIDADIATGISGLLHDERSRDEGRESECEESDSSFDSYETPLPERGGVNYWAPRLYAWLAPRVGTKERFAIALAFALLEGSKTRAWDFAGHEVNYLSIEVMACAVSLTIALCVSFFMEGQWAASLVKLKNRPFKVQKLPVSCLERWYQVQSSYVT